MQYLIKINGCKEGFRAVAHMRILQRDFAYPLFKSKRTTESVMKGEEVLIRVPENKNLSTLLRKVRETGACAELHEQRRVRQSRQANHRHR